MLYHSTRSKDKMYTSKTAILKGICEDGGLFVTDELGELQPDLSGFEDLSYEELAERILLCLIPDYSDAELRTCIRKAYEGKFACKELTPVTRIGSRYLLELYHGPTSAFKDMALCMLPQLMSVALKDEDRRIMILTATSGDTGKAALSGFAGAENIGITVFFPHEKVSDIQHLQMVTQEGDNVSVAAVHGNFDDCQTGVKNIFAEMSRTAEEEYGVSLSSANSINVGRLVPQVVYYFESYRQLVKKGAVRYGEKIDFCVPTGNFGDVLAGYYAKMLGLPVGKLIVASNENKVLYDFLKTGIYNRNREFVKTISPSMDILISSNLERLLYYASGMDCDKVAEWMEQLKETGEFRVPGPIMDEIRTVFDCGYVTNEGSRQAIKRAWEEDGRLIDPHTAVGYQVASENPGKTVILSTASPFKFAEDVYRSIFGDEVLEDGFAYMRKLSKKTGETVPEALAGLKEKAVLHRDIVDIDEMSEFVERAIRK